jgi:hypothetical protein
VHRWLPMPAAETAASPATPGTLTPAESTSPRTVAFLFFGFGMGLLVVAAYALCNIEGVNATACSFMIGLGVTGSVAGCVLFITAGKGACHKA